VLWRRRRGKEAGQQALEAGFHVEAAVEAELELSEVAVRVLGEVEGVVSALMAFFRLPSSVLTARNCGSLTQAAGPFTFGRSKMRSCWKQRSSSETTPVDAPR
jgi:hypothetical protein